MFGNLCFFYYFFQLTICIEKEFEVNLVNGEMFVFFEIKCIEIVGFVCFFEYFFINSVYEIGDCVLI